MSLADLVAFMIGMVIFESCEGVLLVLWGESSLDLWFSLSFPPAFNLVESELLTWLVFGHILVYLWSTVVVVAIVQVRFTSRLTASYSWRSIAGNFRNNSACLSMTDFDGILWLISSGFGLIEWETWRGGQLFHSFICTVLHPEQLLKIRV